MYKDIRAYDIAYLEFKERCRNAWRERFSYLCNDMTKTENEGNYRIFKDIKNTYIECLPETEAI